MQIVRELTVDELVFTLIEMLLGAEGEYWSYYETDPQWWELRLYTRKN